MFDDKFPKEFEDLRKNFALSLQNKLFDIVNLEKKLIENNFEINTIQELYQATHKISGSCGMFNFSKISEAAYKLEEFLKSVVKAGTGLIPEDQSRINDLLSGLKKELEHIKSYSKETE